MRQVVGIITVRLQISVVAIFSDILQIFTPMNLFCSYELMMYISWLSIEMIKKTFLYTFNILLLAQGDNLARLEMYCKNS